MGSCKKLKYTFNAEHSSRRDSESWGDHAWGEHGEHGLFCHGPPMRQSYQATSEAQRVHMALQPVRQRRIPMPLENTYAP